MFYQSLLLTGFCVASQLLSAQNNLKTSGKPDRTIDSLTLLLKQADNDTNKVNLLNSLSEKLEKVGDYDPAKKYAEDALALAQSLPIGETQGWLKGKATAYRRIALIHSDRGNYSEALKNYFNSLETWKEIGDKKGMANAYNNIGITYSKQGKYAEALKTHVIALKIREENGDKQGMAFSYGNIGNMNIQLGNYSEALKSNFVALKLYEEIGDKKGIAQSYNSIGSIYYYQTNYPEALKNYRASLKIKEEIGEKRDLSSSYKNIGNIYTMLENYDEALKNYLTSLKIDEEFGNMQGIANDYNNIGILYASKGDYPTSLKNQFASLRISEEIGDKARMAEACNGIGDVYVKQKNFGAALSYMNKALIFAQETGSKTVMRDAYLGLAKTSHGMNDYKKAYEYQQIYILLKDTLLNEENLRQTTQMKEQYESDKKDAQILVLNKDNDLQTQQVIQQRIIRNILIAGFAIALLVAFLFINRLRLRQLLKMQLIRNSIASDLHDDVGSVLSSIAIFSELANEEVKDKSPKAVALLQTINENARTTIDAMSDTVWAINPQNDRFQNILIRMRTFAAGILEAKNIDVSFPATPALADLKLSMENRKNLYLLFKEAVNNVAKYSACKNCSIQLGLEGKKLSMEITDDGIGFDINDHNAGNGHVNMKKRSDELNGVLDIQSVEGKGTRIHLSFLT